MPVKMLLLLLFLIEVYIVTVTFVTFVQNLCSHDGSYAKKRDKLTDLGINTDQACNGDTLPEERKQG